MRKFGKESTAPTEGVNRESGGWLQNHGALAVCIIAVLAFVLRTVFAYGISADGGFALSGGSDAQYHLHVVESILDGSFILGSDAAINYPIGGLNTNAPLYDFIAAGVGSFAGASTALAVLAPIFGALTCFPVYLIGKELYGTKAGVLAALIFALMALPIVSTVFSNGTEYAFVAFLVAFFIWALIKVVRKINDGEFALKEVIIAGILFGLVVLSWNDFRAVLVLMVITMVIQIVLDRFNYKNFNAALYSYTTIMVIGLAMGAAYYIPANLWDAVFSGPVLIAAITIVLAFIFKALYKSPWIITIPGLIVAFIIIAAVLFFVAPDYFQALMVGNDIYGNSIMSDLIKEQISISKMSSYYGWVLMWMPAILGIWELYVYARKERSHVQLFKMLLCFIPWIYAWTSYGNAASFGFVYAISSAAIIMLVLSKVDFKAYFTSMKTAGFPGCFKKMLKPVPFVSVLVGVFLIAAPVVVYAIDAGIPSNADTDYPFYGNTVYTIETGKNYPISYVYEDFKDLDKDKAVVSWIDTAAGFESRGYNTVNDMNGTGASVVAQIYLAEGASGATAAQIVRIITSTDKDLSENFNDPNVYYVIKNFINNPGEAKEIILSDSTKYGALSSDITDEDAIYIISIKEITTRMSSSEIIDTFSRVKNATGNDIGYYVLDGSMLPLMYGDGNNLSTIAYFAGYTIDTYGAATQFYSYLTYYSNYYPALGTDALYETFLWKALIGPAPSDMGYSSSFSYLYDLIASDGKVKAMPGYGLAGYEIVSWYIAYNADPKATTSSNGWEYMSYSEAIAKQQSEGGLINYMSSIIAYEYVGSSTNTFSGTVTNEHGDALEGITVSVSYFDEAYAADTVYSETKTDSEGRFTALIPDTNYSITYKNGNVKLEATGTEDVVIKSASFVGTVDVGQMARLSPDYMYVLKSDSNEYYIQTVYGAIDSDDALDAEGNHVAIVPGYYSYELRDSSATAVASGNVTLYAGYNDGLAVSIKSYTITATVNDFFGDSVEGGTVVATNSSTGEKYSGAIKEGKAVFYVPSGTYTVSVKDGYITTDTTSLTVTSNKTVTIKAYDAFNVKVIDYPETVLSIYGGGYSAVAGEYASVPLSIGATTSGFTIYGVDGQNVYLGYYDNGANITLESGAKCVVEGSIGTAGTVSFIAFNGATINAVAGSDGKFTAIVMPGTYTVVATNGSDKGYYLDQLEIEADHDMGTLELVDARKITETYQYASGTSKANVSLPFAKAEITFTYNDVEYVIPSVTDTSGKASFIIPDAAKDIKVTINGGAIDNQSFLVPAEGSELVLESTFDEGTEDVSKTITISGKNIKEITVEIEYDMTLKPYSGGDEIECVAGEFKDLAPGQYTAKVDATTGHYFDGTVYVYPGYVLLFGLNVTDVYGVKFTTGANDTITITGDKSNYKFDDVYYFEYDCEYTVKSENSETENVKYLTLYKSEPAEVETIDMTTTAALMKITGYVSVNGDGTVDVTYEDVHLSVEVSGGSFDVEIPSNVTQVEFDAKITKTISSQKYGYSGYAMVNAPTDGTIVNIAVTSDNDVVDYSSDLDGYVSEAVFDAGNLSVDVTVINNTDLVKTYAITAGSAWNMDEAIQIIVPAKESATRTVTGTYEPNGVGIGSNGMTVIVSDYNGTSTKTIPIVDGEVTPAESIVTVKTAADATQKDRLSGNEYMYALTYYNAGGMNVVRINVDDVSGYTILISNYDSSIIKPNNSEFPVSAQTTTVFFIKVIKDLDALENVPSIKVDTLGQTLNISPSEMTIGVDSVSVSGDDAVSERSGMPLGVWFLFGLSIILLILVVWMGSKRGVFSRK